MLTTRNAGKFELRARFGVSLHPEIFYALQVLCDPDARIHPHWRAEALERFPSQRWPITLPGALWTAIPDAIDLAPTPDFEIVASALERVPLRQFQERVLTGMLHQKSAALKLLDEGIPLQQVLASLPRIKREWLGHVGLYPVDASVANTLELLLHSPEEFRAAIVAMVRDFWKLVFAATWEELAPALGNSVERMRQLFEECSTREFLRHTLLPVELHEKRGVLRALRGGYELPLSAIDQCTFTPSVFNDSRFWTTYTDGGSHAPWFPYFDPNLGPSSDRHEEGFLAPAPDVALIFRALGDATRFAMASLIGRQPLSAAELATALSISRPTVSHHLHVLRSADLVHETTHGGSTLISLNVDVLNRLSGLAVKQLLESRRPLNLKRSRRTV